MDIFSSQVVTLKLSTRVSLNLRPSQSSQQPQGRGRGPRDGVGGAGRTGGASRTGGAGAGKSGPGDSETDPEPPESQSVLREIL